jgi:hypothetical protein
VADQEKLIYFKIYYYYRYSALGPVWAETRAQSGDWYSSGTLHPGKFLGVVCHYFPLSKFKPQKYFGKSDFVISSIDECTFRSCVCHADYVIINMKMEAI